MIRTLQYEEMEQKNDKFKKAVLKIQLIDIAAAFNYSLRLQKVFLEIPYQIYPEINCFVSLLRIKVINSLERKCSSRQ